MTRTIAIVGAGYSGAITAINLLRHATHPIRVLLVDALCPDAKGLAYATYDDNFVLNVPAQNMSAFPDKMGDFADYCNTKDSALVATSFISRRIYGEYLQQHLDLAKQTYQGDLALLTEHVLSLHRTDTGYRLICEGGRQLEAHSVILAFGHFAPKPLSTLMPGKIAPEARVIDNPWNIQEIDSIPQDQNVLIVGTGHTAIDTLFRLESGGPRRRIWMLSRHGLHPNGHRPVGEFRKDPALQEKIENVVLHALDRSTSVRKLMRIVRHLIKHLDVDWRDVINGLRAVTPLIWGKLPTEERARFLRHVLPYWDVARHRISPLATKRLTNGIMEDRVKVGAYSIQRIKTIEDGLIEVHARRRNSKKIDVFKVGAVINCSGPIYDIHRTDNELVSFLAHNGILRQDDVKIGFHVADDYSVNPEYPNLHYIGPMLKARYWEAIAVPELRVHSYKLAQKILETAS